MLAFYIKGGLDEAKAFIQNLELFSSAPSWGGYESLANHPSVTMPNLNIEPNLIRLSIGLEHLNDLKADLDQALRSAVAVNGC